jgi:hypothetical protein
MNPILERAFAALENADLARDMVSFSAAHWPDFKLVNAGWEAEAHRQDCRYGNAVFELTEGFQP